MCLGNMFRIDYMYASSIILYSLSLYFICTLSSSIVTTVEQRLLVYSVQDLNGDFRGWYSEYKTSQPFPALLTYIYIMYVDTSQQLYFSCIVKYPGIMVKLMYECSGYFMLIVNCISETFSFLFLYYPFITALFILVFSYLFICIVSTSVILQYNPP